jgi:cytochrome c oxidase subunit 3
MSHEQLPPGHFSYFEPEQAYHASKLGVWIFLATEVHLFGGIFAIFAVYRARYLEMFNASAHLLDWRMGLINTVFLLTSSYFMVRGVDAAQKGLNDKVTKWLNLTILFGCFFFIVKFFEYSAKFAHEPPIYPSTNIFFGLYFTMTAIHAVHVAVGVGLLVWLRALAQKKRYSPVYYTPVEMVGLYWHLVDVVWIFLFPILYLLPGISFTGAGH